MAIVPLLNVVPSFDVTVCEVLSLLVHFTVVPTLTVKVAGEKDIPAMPISPEPTGRGGEPGGDCVPPDLLQEIRAVHNKKQIIRAGKKSLLFINIVLIFKINRTNN